MAQYDPNAFPFERVRSDYQILPTPAWAERTYVDCVNQPRWTPSGAPYPHALNGTSKVMVDWVVPRFHARKKAGEKFFNPMYREEVTVSTSGGPWAVTAKANACGTPGLHAQWRKQGGPIIQYWVPRQPANSHGHELPVIATCLPDSEVARVQKAVSTEVWSKRGTADSELWESLAEARQTIAMLDSPLRRLQDLSKRLLQSAERNENSRRFMREVSSGYLMYRYGISPIARDIRNLLSSLRKAGGDKEVTSRAKEQITASQTFISTHDDGLERVTLRNQVTESLTVRAMSLDRGYVSLANNLGLTWKGLAMLPWQLTSYSFVADWFFNLGSYLQASIPAFGWNQLGTAMVTTRVTANAYAITGAVNMLPSVYTIDSPSNGAIGIVRVTTTREPLLPASLEMKSNFRFDEFNRAADAAALIASRLVKVNRLLGDTPSHSAFRDRKAYRRWAETLNFYVN